MSSATSVILEELRLAFPAGVALRDDVLLMSSENRVLSFVKASAMRVGPLRASHVLFFSDLKRGLAWDEIGLVEGLDQIAVILKELHARGHLRDMTENHYKGSKVEAQVHWLAEFSPDPNGVQREISESKPLILGCGGIGAAVVQHLVGMGVQNYVLVDFDRVDPANFNRQFTYTDSDLGSSKAAALANYIESRVPGAQVRVQKKRIDSQVLLEKVLAENRPDFVFCCADYPLLRIKEWVARSARSAGVPCTFGNVGVTAGTVGPLLVSDKAKEAYADHMAQVARTLSDVLDKTTIKSSIGPVNTFVGTQMAFDWLMGVVLKRETKSLNRTLELNYLDWSAVVARTWIDSEEPNPAVVSILSRKNKGSVGTRT